MAKPKNTIHNTLKLERICERSRLEPQVIAAAYELVSPVARRALPAPDTEPPLAHTQTTKHHQAGGSHA